MKKPRRAMQKMPDYPEETSGGRLAAKARKLASKLTPEEEAEHFRHGMAMIYGSQSKEILAFNEADLAPVHPVHPRRLLRALR